MHVLLEVLVATEHVDTVADGSLLMFTDCSIDVVPVSSAVNG